MNPERRRTLILAVTALLVAAATGIVIGIAEDDGDEPVPGEVAVTQPGADTGGDDLEAPAEDRDGERGGGGGRLPPPENDPDGIIPGPSGPAPETAAERAAAGAARDYVRALTRRKPRSVCGSFEPAALEDFDFPRGGPACASGVRSSIGEAPRGRPVWKRSTMTREVSATVEGDSARVVATIFTVYEDVREPTIEDDIIYLERSGERWLLAKPSSTFYRAVGISEIPPSVISPPA